MIRSTFSGFNMATLALMANQRALDVTGQNLSNINTEGYTRQRLDLTSLNPVGNSISSSSFDAKVGQGVLMTGVSQIRDPFLDIQYRNELPKLGTVDAKAGLLERIGNIFDETDSEAIRSRMNAVVTQLTNLATPENAGSASADALVRSACEVLIDGFRQNGVATENVRNELIDKMNQSVLPQIETYLSEIVNLNISIKNSQILGNPALELQDQRNQMLDELSTYMPIEVTYKDETLGGGIVVQTLDVKLKTADGQKTTIISDNKKGEFTFTENGDGTGLLEVKGALDGAQPVDISAALGDGILKGNMDMLNKSEAFDNPVTEEKGIGFYQQTFDMFINEFATKMNYLNSVRDEDGNVIEERPLFTTLDGKTEGFTATNIRVSEGWITGQTKITLSNDANAGSTDYTNVLEMINHMSSDTIEFGIYKDVLDADGNIVYEDDGVTPKQEFKAIFKGTLYECYNNIQNTQAIERQAAESLLLNHQTVADQIAGARDSVSGVSMDEETMDLMRFSQSYNAAARLMTTMDELLDKLINGTGVVGR